MQSIAPSTERPWWQFKPGQSGNPGGHRARLARIAAKARELAEGLGTDFDRLSALDREFLLKAATLFVRRPRTAEDERIAIKTARSLISDVERRTCRHEAPGTQPRGLAGFEQP